MPTGYTAPVLDGTITELRDWALLCARALGVCIDMRDEPLSATIPYRFEPSSYHLTELEKLCARREVLLALTPEQATAEAVKARATYDLNREERRERHRVAKQRYVEMHTKVAAWEGAPEGIKEFMLQQLMEGEQFDCAHPDRFVSPPPPETGEAWVQGQLVEIAEGIAYHAKQHAEEIKRVRERNEWLAQLRASLGEA